MSRFWLTFVAFCLEYLLCMLTCCRCILMVADCCLESDPSHSSLPWSRRLLLPFESFFVPGEEGNTSLVPNVRWDATGGDLHWRDQVGPLRVQIDWNLNSLSVFNLTLVDPLEIDAGQSTLEGFGELNSCLCFRILSALYGEALHDETLGVLRNLLISQVKLELEMQLFEGVVILLSNCLAGRSQVRFWEE